MNKFRILTTDILIADVVVSLEGNNKLLALAAKYGYQPGGKYPIDEMQRAEFSAAVDGVNVQIFPGGSAANTSRTLSKLLPGLTQATFVGVLDKGIYSDMIVESFRESGVELNCELPINCGVSPETAISFVVKYPDGQRFIATYPGNAKRVISEAMFPESLIAASDAIFLQGSTRRKFEPSVVDHILKHRWEHGKQLILALPTTAFQPEYFAWLQSSANIVLSNVTELGFVFGSSNTEEILERLQEQQRQSVDILAQKGFRSQVAMITDEDRGCYVVTHDKVVHIPTTEISPVNTLGAGDASYAGFIASKVVLGMSKEFAAQTAMALGAANCLHDGATLPDPRKALEAISPHVFAEIERREEVRMLGR